MSGVKGMKSGFAAMTIKQARQIQRMGGKASPQRFKKGDKRTIEAGRKGGKVSKRW